MRNIKNYFEKIEQVIREKMFINLDIQKNNKIGL